MGNWPELKTESWIATKKTLHLYLQIAGKIALESSPLMDHWWNCMMRVTSRGVRTELLTKDQTPFQLQFDFISHKFRVSTDSGVVSQLDLYSQSVADFYAAVRDELSALSLWPKKLWPEPVEIPNAIPFPDDHEHHTYDPEQVNKYWRTLVRIDAVYQRFQREFMGKQSPNLLFWGAMDFSTSRYSGRMAPPNRTPALNLGPQVMLEAYSREVNEFGFWPDYGESGAFFSYFYPEPDGYRDSNLGEGAFWDSDLGEFILPYEIVRDAPDPDQNLLDVMNANYLAGSQLAHWDNATLLRKSNTAL